MKKVLLWFLILSPALLGAQVVSRVAGLEGDERYMSLLEQEAALHKAEDSIVNIIEQTRTLFAQDTPDKSKHGGEIVRLEAELYGVRNDIGKVVSAINAIEQQFVINNLGVGAAPSEVAEPSAPSQKESFGEYIKRNLPTEDYLALRAAEIRESDPPRLISQYLQNYATMKSDIEHYDTLPEEEAVAAYEDFQALRRINDMVEDSISTAWDEIYDLKVYAYTLLLDRMNRSAILSSLEKEFNEMNQRIATARDRVDSEVIYSYPLKVKLVLSYEAALAGVLNDYAVSDSVIEKYRLMERLSYDLPRLEIARRNFIPYEELKFSTTPVYTASNPIPEQKVYDYGTVYKIDVGIFSKKQPVSLFKGASPVSYEVLPDGRFRYCIGAFREVYEAVQGVSDLKKRGFRRPEVVVWRDGEFESLGDLTLEENALFYRVEIDAVGETLADGVISAIETSAPGKEISRVVAGDGNFMYIVGSFDSAQAAQAVIDAITVVDENVVAKIVTIDK